MELINKQYRINSIYKREHNGIVYQATDLIRNKIVLLKVLSNSIKNKPLIEFLTKNFISIRSIKHKTIAQDMLFDLICTIDNKPNYNKQYFFITEYIDTITLNDYTGEFTVKQVINMMIEISKIADYLYTKGKIYVDFKADNLFLFKDKGNLKLKLKSYISANESNINYIINKSKDTSDKAKDNKENLYSYIYSIASIGNYLLSKVSNKEDNKYVHLRDIVKSINIEKTLNEYKNVSSLLITLSKLCDEVKNEDIFRFKEVLNFDTPTICRDNLINYILNVNKHKQEGIYKEKLITVNGSSGIGKTRLLKEIAYRLKMEGSYVYTSKISENKQKLKPIVDILKTMISVCQNRASQQNKYHLLSKYGSELVKIVPELSYIDNIKPSTLLKGRREELRLYNRILNFMLDFIKDEPTYIILDDIDYCDEHTIKLITYMVNNIKNSPLVFIVSYNRELNKERYQHNKNLLNNKDIHELKLMRFNINETAEFIQNILEMNYLPIKFATRVMRDTKGNPAYIEEVLKNLYNHKELFINEDGYWERKYQDYAEIRIPSNIEQAINEQLNMTTQYQYEVLKCVCIFKTPVSWEVIKSLVGFKDDKLVKVVDELLEINILEKTVGDYGFTYNLKNVHTKQYVYRKINIIERKMLHKKASIVLRDIYEVSVNFNYDEIIYHCIMSGEKEKAIDYVIKFAKNMQNMMIISQAIELWNYAKELLEDSDNYRKLEVLYNLSKLYLLYTDIENCMKLARDGLEIAISYGYSYYIVNFKNVISDLLNMQKHFKEAESYVKEAKLMAEEIGYIDGYLESVKILNRVYFSVSRLDDIFTLCNKYINVAQKQQRVNYLGHLYNQIGVVNILRSNMDEGLIYVNKGVSYFEKCNNIEDILGYLIVLNNLGVIYEEYIDDFDKALHYFRKGLELSKEYNLIDNALSFNNSLGESLIRRDLYSEALAHFLKLKEESNEYNDKRLMFIVNVNIAIVYLKMGEYEKCYEYTKIINKLYDKEVVRWQDENRYKFFLIEFYYKFNRWELIEDIHKELINQKNSMDEYLVSETTKTLTLCCKNGKLDYNKLDIVIDNIKKMQSYRNRRYAVIQILELALLYNDNQYAKKVLKKDDELSKIFTNEYFDMKNKLFHAFIEDKNKEELIRLKAIIKSKSIQDLEAIVNFSIGNLHLNDKEYVEAINCYINTLYIFHRTVSKIRNNKLIRKFIYSIIIKDAKKRLNECIKHIYKEEDSIDDTLLTADDSLYDMLRNNKFLEMLTRQKCSSQLVNIDSIQMLVDNFTSNCETNLKLILRYAMRMTLADRGFIAVKKDESYYIIAEHSIGNVQDNKYIYNIIDYVNKNRNIIIFNRVDNKVQNKLISEQMNDDITGLVCLPIIEKKDEYTINERRKMSNIVENKIVAYLYIETDKLINRISNDLIPMFKTLASLAYVNLDIYSLKAKSSTDKLMGIKNREYLEYSFDDILKNVSEDSIFSIIMADIDRFKNVNDKFGHQKGDQILRKIGKILLSSVRRDDIVGRYGGEEFLIILYNNDTDTAYSIAEKIRKKVENDNLLGKDNPLTISLGISTYPTQGTHKEELIAKADQALYSAKKTGRNKTVIWSNTIGKTARLDKLAGIVSGNIVNDQRNVLVMIEIIDLLKRELSKKDKIYLALGRLIEIVEAYSGVLITLNKEKYTKDIYSRKRFTDDWIEYPNINKKIIEKIIKTRRGEFLIDWENIEEKELFTGNPNWFSLILVPIIFEGKLKGILQLSVPLNEKEFDYETYNFVSIIGEIMSGML
ncbi:diguanylate cyclase [Clostridiaceae bacterium M8S5]|nr:diguanylate cyclase [Clostridiaceae bacterium M8S5]